MIHEENCSQMHFKLQSVTHRRVNVSRYTSQQVTRLHTDVSCHVIHAMPCTTSPLHLCCSTGYNTWAVRVHPSVVTLIYCCTPYSKLRLSFSRLLPHLCLGIKHFSVVYDWITSALKKVSLPVSHPAPVHITCPGPAAADHGPSAPTGIDRLAPSRTQRSTIAISKILSRRYLRHNLKRAGRHQRRGYP